MNYRLVSIDYVETLPSGGLARLVVSVAYEDNPQASTQFMRCPDLSGKYEWRKMNTGNLVSMGDPIYTFLTYSVEKMLPAQQAILGKLGVNDKVLQGQSRFDNLQT